MPQLSKDSLYKDLTILLKQLRKLDNMMLL
nr:MAG TPA: hypothetical protein [Crassvirales sp.]